MTGRRCEACECVVCWAVLGYAEERCRACKRSACRVSLERSLECADWLARSLEEGLVQQSTDTRPPHLPTLDRATRLVMSRIEDAPPADAPTVSSAIRRDLATLEDQIAARKITITEALDRALMDNTEILATCPVCRHRPVRLRPKADGVCRTCWLHRLADQTREVIAEIEGTQDHDAAKQDLKRTRQALGELVPEDLRAHARRRIEPTNDASGRGWITSDAPVHRECPTCGTLVPDHGDGPCRACEERKARRAER